MRRARVLAEILDAAWDLARQHGLAALSLREVAARVGMRAPSLYTYVESKDALYDEMFAQGQRRLLATMTDAPPAPGRAGLIEGTRDFVAFCTADPTRFQLLFQRVVPGFQPSPASYALAQEYFERSVAAMHAAGLTDPRHVDLWTATVSGLVSQQLANEPDGDRWTGLLDEALDLLCDHAGLPPAP